jgi:hypothetical protein
MLDGPPLLFIEFFEIGGGHRQHMEMEEGSKIVRVAAGFSQRRENK